jgi:hypothetical protein
MNQLQKAFRNLKQAMAIMEDVEMNLYKHEKDSVLNRMCQTAQDRLSDLRDKIKNEASIAGIELSEGL